MARRESISASSRSREIQTTASRAERSSFEPTGPLIDADWLLGPARRPFLSTRMIVGLGSLSILCVAFILSAPTWSRAWLRHQLADQFLNGTTPELRKEGLVGLAGLLPESLSEVVAGFAKFDRRENESIYHALNEYLSGLERLPIEVRRAKSAEVVYQLESALQIVSPEAMPLVVSLTTLVQNGQLGDTHPAAAVTLASCDRILKYRSEASKEAALLPEIVASAKSGEASTGNRVVASTASLSDDASASVMKLSSFSLSDSTGDAVQEQDPHPRPLSHKNGRGEEESLTHTTMQPMVFTPLEHTNDTSRVSTSKEGVTLQQRLLKANRFVPISGSVSVEIESKSSRPEAPTEEAVLGIRRQQTQDLLRLLTSVQPRVAQAAFHELESRRLSREELELAVELSQGTSERRIAAMERLVANPNLDPLNWLSWMACESDREVRFKAVSLLGSLNNDEANKQLRMMSVRERDQEISRHIQQALVANGFSPTSNR